MIDFFNGFSEGLTNIIKQACENGQGIITLIIYMALLGLFLYVMVRLFVSSKKLKRVEHVIDLVKNSEKTEINTIELKIIQNDFPIMVNELKDVYDTKKHKQISAIDIFEDNLVIPSNETSTIRSIINSLTGLGLFGTFVGLISSLSKINVEQTEDAMAGLLSAIAPAISTTIIGVLFSLLATYRFSHVKSKYKKTALELEKKLMEDKPKDTNPAYYYDNFTTFTGEKYEMALSVIVDNFLEQMKKSLNKDLEDYKKVIKEAMESLKTGEEEFTKGANGLNSTVDNINKYLIETDKLNKNFEVKLSDFSKALGDFNTIFKDSQQTTTTVLDNVKAIDGSLHSTNESLLISLQNELSEVQKGFKIMEEMNFKFKEEIMNTPTQLNDSIDQLCQRINGLSNKFDEKINNSFNDINGVLNELNTHVKKLEKMRETEIISEINSGE